MILGVLLNATILEVKEYYEMNNQMSCMYKRLREKKDYRSCKKELFFYPDRPYLSECLYPPGNKNCEIFGLKFKEFE
jgi:hypothetical protein